MKKNIVKIIPALCITMALLGCGSQSPEKTPLTTQPSTQPSTQPTSQTTVVTEPSSPEVPSTEVLPSTEATQPQLREVDGTALDEFLFDWAEECMSAEQEPSEKVTITGLCTPVELHLEGMTVKTVQAYGRTLEVDAGPDEGDIAFSLNQWQDVLVINGEEECWLVTQEQTFDFPGEDGVHTWFRINDDGELEYHKYADAAEFMEMDPTAPLEFATDRGNLYSEEGTVDFQDTQPVLNVRERTLLGHMYDLDAVFTMGRIMGWNDFEGCENADDVLQQNKESGSSWLTYPYEPKEPAQCVEFEGLTLNLPQCFAQERSEDGTLLLRGETLGYEDNVIKVITGEAENGYQGIEAPIASPSEMLDWDWANRGEKSAESFALHNVPCLYVYDDETEIVRGYYLKDNRWWVIEFEVENVLIDWMLTYVTCGTTE